VIVRERFGGRNEKIGIGPATGGHHKWGPVAMWMRRGIFWREGGGGVEKPILIL